MPKPKRKQIVLVEQIGTRFEILEEATEENGRYMKIRVPRMSIADTINGNQRVYPMGPWSREMKNLSQMAEQGRLFGSYDHPADGKSRLGDSAIRWTRIWMDGKETHGEGIVLHTSKGRDLEEVLRSGGTPDVSSRAFGSAMRMEWQGKLADVVQEDLKVVSFDAVIGGSVEGSQMHAVNEQKGDDDMDFKAVIEALKAEHKDAFEWYDGQLKESYDKIVEQKVLEEAKKLKKTEDEIRAEEAGKYKPQLDKASKIITGLRALIGENADLIGDGKPLDDLRGDQKDKEVAVMREQLETLKKKLEVSDAKVAELNEQESSRSRQAALDAKIAEVVTGKAFSKMLTERLHEKCTKPEEVDAALVEAQNFVTQILTEAKVQPGSQPSGNGKVENNETRPNVPGQLTEQQIRHRRAAGLPVN